MEKEVQSTDHLEVDGIQKMTAEDALKALGSRPEGLTEAEVETAQKKYGKNVINVC